MTTVDTRRAVPWPARRAFPLIAVVVMILIGMAGTIWGPVYYGQQSWAVPDDLWATLVAAQRLLDLDLAGLYTPPTNLITFPGAAVILVPVAAVLDAAGLPIQAGHQGVHPTGWLVAGPLETLISAVVLFAADALAERLGASLPKRFLLAAAEATALWNVTIRWGHPEDAVAVGLVLYAVLALGDERPSRAAWLTGAAVAVQPLVLLAFPILAVAVKPRRLPGFVARAATPPIVTFGRRRGGELDGDHPRGHQPAQRAEHRPPHAVDLRDVPGPAPERRIGGRRARPGPCPSWSPSAAPCVSGTAGGRSGSPGRGARRR